MKKREDLFDVFVSRDQVGRKVIVYVKDTTLRMTFGSTKLDIRSAGSRIRLDSVQLESYTTEQKNRLSMDCLRLIETYEDGRKKCHKLGDCSSSSYTSPT